VRVKTKGGIIDIMPTIADLLNLKRNEEFEGRSLIPLITQNKKGNRVLFSELSRVGRDLVSARDRNWTYIYNIKEKREELYDLNSDPEEKFNVIL
jgi:arylsulfatase A-like enzyme